MFRIFILSALVLGGFGMDAGNAPENTIILSAKQLSGDTPPLAGRIDRLPPGCAGVRVEALLSETERPAGTGETVLRLHLSQQGVPETSGEAEGVHSAPVRMAAGKMRRGAKTFSGFSEKNA